MDWLIPILSLVCLKIATGFYLPGIAPVNYCKDEKDTCKVYLNKVKFLNLLCYFCYWFVVVFFFSASCISEHKAMLP